MNSIARGGTELLYDRLKKSLPDLVDKVQIICSRPQLHVLEDKPRILWLHDLPQDPASQCLRDPSYRSNFNAIVFVSHWQQQQYQQVLGIPYGQGIVIKNGVPLLTPNLPKANRYIPCGNDEQQCDVACKFTHEKNKLRFIYTSTPHRGLVVLAAVADYLAKVRQDWELHVYSSFQIYGRDEQDAQFQPIYDQLRNNPCVVYHGTQPHSVVQQALLDAHVFVYPSIYPETSCMAVQEAMMAGCLAITSNFGALPETCGEWAWMMQFDENLNNMAQHTFNYMVQALDRYDTDMVQEALRVQTMYYQNFYAWDLRIPAWKRLLEIVIKQGKPVEKLVIE